MVVSRFGLFLAILLLSGCVASSFLYMRSETAQRIAAPAWMIKRDILASPYVLRAYERIHNKGGVANIYIEGGASEFSDINEWSDNPTPINPVALHLSSKDSFDNVIYIARPCQYNGLVSGDKCDSSDWNENRFSERILNAFDDALDDIAGRYGIYGFNLIGYSGGGVIALLLANNRSDILSVRTIASPLDIDTQYGVLGDVNLSGSLNPKDFASKLSNIPQYHFIGGQDRFIPPSILHSYVQSVSDDRCIKTMFIQEASHDRGWVDKWSELLDEDVICRKSVKDVYVNDLEPSPLPKAVFTVREKPAKP